MSPNRGPLFGANACGRSPGSSIWPALGLERSTTRAAWARQGWLHGGRVASQAMSPAGIDEGMPRPSGFALAPILRVP